MPRAITSAAVAVIVTVSSPVEAAPRNSGEAELFRNDSLASSILRSRENFHRINSPTHILEQLGGLFFHWKPEYGGQRDLDCFVVGDLSLVPPEVLLWEIPGEVVSGVNYERLTPVLVEAIKEIECQVEKCYSLLHSLAEQFRLLELTVSDHTTRLQSQQARISSLQTQVSTHDTSLTVFQKKNEELEKQNLQLAEELRELREVIQQMQDAAAGE